MGYQPIEDYGIIGDLHTVALVGRDGSIDFLCLPRFDSPSVFAALLDDEKGGRFSIAPTFPDANRRQLYLPDTNVLVSRFLSEAGVAEITDFMPVEEIGPVHNIHRQVKTVRGQVTFRLLCQPRFDYARAGHRVEQSSRSVVFESRGPDELRLRLSASVPIEVRGADAVAEFSLGAGQTAEFILEIAGLGSSTPPASREILDRSLDSTVRFWRRWVRRSTYAGRWREMVTRSALTLKLLVDQDDGSIVAAPTFGLPEQVGGPRNWDYRYTWIRDTSFSLFALDRLGYREEAEAFMRWIGRRCAGLATVEPGRSPLHIMYRTNGGSDLDEIELGHLDGYRGSRPVRIGNGAHAQLQLDIYGELIDTLYLANRHGDPIPYDLWRRVAELVDWLCDHWAQPDEGIWEVRGGRHDFLHSRLMCWVALDRALKIVRNRSFPAPQQRWTAARDAVFHDIYDHFWDDQRGCFVQRRGSRAVDASSLLMPLVHFIAFCDPRWLSHLKVIEHELAEDALLYRYRGPEAVDDGLPGGEGTFSMCSFWFVENLARSGQVDRARFFFEQMHSYANHLGLYSEQIGRTGQHLGNFPQAFTHLGLITAALSLDRALSHQESPGRA